LTALEGVEQAGFICSPVALYRWGYQQIALQSKNKLQQSIFKEHSG
jgi:hypothetical protein